MPRRAHVGGVVVALLGISPERFAKEFEQGLAHGSVDQFGLDCGFGVHQVGRALAVAPIGQGTRGHFMQHHGGGETFGGGVPAPAALRTVFSPAAISAELPWNRARTCPFRSTITADNFTLARPPDALLTCDSTVTLALFPAISKFAACT